MIKECFILGTRPEVSKLALLILEMDSYVLFTGQQRELASEMFKVFDIKPDIDLDLMREDQSLCGFLSRAISEIDKIIAITKPKRIWVQGDTSSALAGAIVAKMHQIPLVHVEAGLRTYDQNNPFPEEIIRTQIDSIADIMFAPTKLSKDNLLFDNLSGLIYQSGNTIVDALEMIKPILPNEKPRESYVLATIHRRESFGKDMLEIFKALKELSKEIKIILPAHPNPNVQKAIKEIGLETVPPINYVGFLYHLKHCEYVITDSGGVQEEAPSFQKKVIVLRKTTERPEAVDAGYSILIKEMKKDHILEKIREFAKKKVVFKENPFGSGDAVSKIKKIIKEIDEQNLLLK